MEQLVFKTEIYEGPLDLLLDIIAKNKMSIFDIKISLIFEQYMAYLREMQEMNMEIAGEFITEASRLMLIKPLAPAEAGGRRPAQGACSPSHGI